MLLFLNFPGFNATFTNLDSNRKLGPKSVDNPYKGQDHDGEVKILNTSRGIQEWTVPYTGRYRIEAVGAAGGYNNQSSSQYRGRGARMVGTFNLSQGEMIQILVGQEGKSNPTSSGGGGGTFVVRASDTPLIVAGGGGGIKAVKSRHQGCDAKSGKSGNSGHNSSWSGGTNGDGGKTGSQSDDPSGESNENHHYFYLTQCKVSCCRKLLI